ncbi:MAG: hypothetical protein ACOYNI_04755 [Acidimicrobiia bacterium]
MNETRTAERTGNDAPTDARQDLAPDNRILRSVGAVLTALSIAWAFVVQSLFFAQVSNIQGDAAYHRGVAYTMLHGALQGEGPIHQLLAFYGGLYPMALAALSAATGASIDSVLSIGSWFWGCALPLSLLFLGRRLWPGRWFETGILVFLGTVAGSIPVDKTVVWVNSPTLASSNLWPAYPRDIAMVLGIVAIAIALGTMSPWRSVATGIVLALAVSAQVQIAVVFGAFVVACFLLDRRSTMRTRLVGVLVVTGSTILASAWWWVPRALEYTRARPLLLASFPGNTQVAFHLLFAALGLIGILGVIGGVAIGTHWRQVSVPLRLFALWAAVGAVGSLLAFAAPDLGVITQRRALLLTAFPLVIVATAGLAILLRRVPAVVAVGLLVAVAVPALVFGAQEVKQTREIVFQRWPVSSPFKADYPASQWDPVTATLRARAERAGSVRVVAPDGDSAYLWFNSGAQSFGPWLPTWSKLGFDPVRAVPGNVSIEARRAAVRDGFAGGIPTLCQLADRSEATAIIVRRRNGLIATHDTSAMGLTEARTVRKRTPVPSGGVLVESPSDVILTLPAQESLPMRWTNTDGVREVEVETFLAPEQPPVIVTGDQRISPTSSMPTARGRLYRYEITGPLRADAAVTATTHTSIRRIRGYEPSSVPITSGDGPIVLDPARLCSQ